jgi:hypothetical protein
MYKLTKKYPNNKIYSDRSRDRKIVYNSNILSGTSKKYSIVYPTKSNQDVTTKFFKTKKEAESFLKKQLKK